MKPIFYQPNVGLFTGVSLLLAIIMVGIFAPLLSPHDPLSVHLSNRLASPSWEYPFGTDHLGRCVLSRLIYGIRVSVIGAFIILLLTFLISLPVGLLTGYKRRYRDGFLMRLIDGTLAIPDIIFTVAIVGILGPGVTHMILAIILVRWANYVRFIRSLVLKCCQEHYILSARMAGNSHVRIMWRYILPTIFSPLVVFAALDIGKIVILLAGLSFLGLGTQPPTPEWGVMLHDSTTYFQIAPHIMIFPGLAIMLFVFTCQLISEQLKKGSGTVAKEG
ncbi:ABC transporter permease [Priestia koreensis]|uniref:Nickel transporter permease NikC n=1 Tax=Priestia koreensis TaxID=284581 RepID=A0A0M0L0X3_9BACI|nr:ABC transporter permease subunit [Priestia koreensis]KOO44303.1 nickel transporter permease NikC [Priestia koreensis]